MSTKRGMIIVLEGMDRVGKSTQASKLVQSLRSKGLSTELIRFPDRSTPTGNLISQYLSGKIRLNDHAVHLLFTANRWEKFDQMFEMVKSGVTLVIDRYSYSGVAYTTAKGLDFHWSQAPEQGLLKPDCVVFLSNDISEIKKRENFGQEIYEKIEFQRLVRNKYMKMIDSHWDIIDTTNKTIEDVHQEILKVVKHRSNNISEKVDLLW